MQLLEGRTPVLSEKELKKTTSVLGHASFFPSYLSVFTTIKMASLKNALLRTGGLLTARNTTNTTMVVSTDVVIIGGGASGSHAAVRLTDYGQDVIVIEKQSNLGGAVDSYTDPTTNKPYDFGVMTFVDYGNASGFFDRFEIPVSARENPTLDYLYADFQTGQLIPNYTGPSWDEEVAALETYLAIAEKYENMLVPGYWDFPNASDIPEDLLMNFGDFVEKYNFTDALPLMFSTTGLGMGNILNKMTMPVMQAFGAQMARVVMGTQSSFSPSSGRNQDLFDAIAKFLGDKVFYNTHAINSTRSDDGVTVTVWDVVSGQETIVNAKKLLIAIEPVATKLAAFDLDGYEEEVFSKFQFSREYTGIVSNPSLPTNHSVTNLPYDANYNTYKTFPDFNFTTSFDCVDYDSDLFRIIMVGDEQFGPEEAKGLVQRNFKTLAQSGILAASNQTDLKFEAFSEHGPMHDSVSGEDLQAGFIQDLLGLQGLRSTWYTGAAFSSNYQTILWQYNEILLPQMLAA